jgi:hypothetical protein
MRDAAYIYFETADEAVDRQKRLFMDDEITVKDLQYRVGEILKWDHIHFGESGCLRGPEHI